MHLFLTYNMRIKEKSRNFTKKQHYKKTMRTIKARICFLYHNHQNSYLALIMPAWS